MKNLFLYLTLVSSLLACGKAKDSNKAVCDMLCEAAEYSLPAIGEDELPNEALTFSTNLLLVNFSEPQTVKALAAADLVKKVVGTIEFKTAVLNHTYKGIKQFANSNGLSNQQIYDRILLGAEQLSNVKNNALDAELELYYDDTTTIGYTFPDSERIWMNTKFFNVYSPISVSSNLMHEWLHKLGFNHDTESTEQRPYSVPYAVGYIVRDLARHH